MTVILHIGVVLGKSDDFFVCLFVYKYFQWNVIDWNDRTGDFEEMIIFVNEGKFIFWNNTY